MNDGYIMENIIYEHINKLKIFDEIVYERDIVKRYGREAVGIDYLLVHKNNIILLQIKWKRTRRRETNDIKNFLNSVHFLTKKLKDKQYMFGLYISRMEPFSDNKNYLENNKVHCIYDFESMNSLANNVASYLQNYMTDYMQNYMNQNYTNNYINNFVISSGIGISSQTISSNFSRYSFKSSS